MVKQGELLVQIERYIQDTLTPGRYRHTLGVVEVAVKLAKAHGENMEQARMAALLHDCGKHCPPDEAISMLEAIGYIPNEVERHDPMLLHGRIGALVARERFHVTDSHILSAVACHTTGKTGMSRLDKVVYVADYIEPGRDGDWVHPLRTVAYHDLDDCVVMCADSTLTHVMRKGKPIHPDTMLMRNELLMERDKAGVHGRVLTTEKELQS